MAVVPSYDPEHPPHLPTPALLLGLSQLTIMSLLGHITDWLVDRQDEADEADEAAQAEMPSTIFTPAVLRRKPGKPSLPASAVFKPSPASARPRRRPPLPSAHELNWILSLLSRLHALQAGDDIASLRALAKVVTAMVEASQDEVEAWEDAGGRSTEEGERLRDEEDAEGRAKGWMVVAVVAGVWKQDDLWNSNL